MNKKHPKISFEYDPERRETKAWIEFQGGERRCVGTLSDAERETHLLTDYYYLQRFLRLPCPEEVSCDE